MKNSVTKLPQFRLLGVPEPETPTVFSITPDNEQSLRAFLRKLPELKGEPGESVKGDIGEGRRGRRGERGLAPDHFITETRDGYELRFNDEASEPIVIRHGIQGGMGPMPLHDVGDKQFRLQLPSGAWGPWIRQVPGPPGDKGDKGEKGDTGPAPDHEFNGSRLRFRKPGGAWGAFADLRGPPGAGGGGRGKSANPGYSSIALNGNNLEFTRGKQGPLGPDTVVDLSGLSGVGNKNISIENVELNDEFVFFRAASAFTITKLSFVIQGTGSPSATVFVRFGPDRSAPATNVVNAGTVVTNETTGDIVTVFDNANVSADDWIIVEVTAVGGTTRNELSLTMEFG